MVSQSFYAIVAGVGAGTGRSVAVRFARAYPVVLISRSPENHKDIVAEINKSGGQAIGISADMADVQSVASAFETIAKEFPGKKMAAAIYNVGGLLVRKPFLELTPEDMYESWAAHA